MQRHVEALSVFHAAQRQHLGTAGGHFQNGFVADGRNATSGGHDARVGGEDAVHVGVNLANVGTKGHGERHGGGVGTATAERGGIALGVDALEAGDDGNVSQR